MTGRVLDLLSKSPCLEKIKRIVACVFPVPLGLAQPKITGKTTVMEGETLKLSCDAESAPPAVVALSEVGSHVPLVTGMQSAILIIPNATTDHSGRYSCTSVHLTKSLASTADVTVMNKCKYLF